MNQEREDMLAPQDFMCEDYFGNICAIVTSCSEEYARNVFYRIDWHKLYVADNGCVNYRLIESRHNNDVQATFLF